MTVKKGYCSVMYAPLRREPAHTSEMVSQLLRGETFDILQQEEKWSLVRCDHDGYEGWISNPQYEPFVENAIPEAVRRRRERESENRATSPSEYALNHFMGVPYLWGGRSKGGMDCSGLAQVCFAACGYRLPRDASQQALCGVAVPSLAASRPDDLLFFGDSPDHITHVAIHCGDGVLVHAYGYVRIAVADENGICILHTNAYTHKLQAIRRLF